MSLEWSNEPQKCSFVITEDMSLPSIYKRNKKRRGKSRYLLSVIVEAIKNCESIPAKVVYARSRNKRNEYLRLISTDTTLDENEIIRIYGKRWDIEVFSKSAKVISISVKNAIHYPMMQ